MCVDQVDITYIPFVERFDVVLAEVFKHNITEGRPKLATWIEVHYKNHLCRISYFIYENCTTLLSSVCFHQCHNLQSIVK